MPSNPLDAYGLMLSAIVDPNPVMVLPPKALLRAKAGPGERIPGEPEDERALSRMIDAPIGDRSKWTPNWPDVEDVFVPIGQARVAREGRDVTIVSYGRMVVVALQASIELAKEGIDIEVIDLRTLVPCDWPAVERSVKKTHKLVCINEDTSITNFGEHIIRRVVEELFYELHAPPRLLAGAPVPGVGLADALERATLPQVETVVQAVRGVAQHEP